MKKLFQDRWVRFLFVGGFAYALFLSQGIPLWDDDFTSWFWKIKDQSIWHYVWEWISPVSTQPQYWGFNERSVQSLIYKLCYLISGYDSWAYFLYKDLVYAGLGIMIYLWSLRLVRPLGHERWVASAAAVFFLLTPGPIAAHVMHQDLATTAELFFLILTYLIWGQVEKTPEDWKGFPCFKDSAQRAWLLRWAGLSFLTYLGYKSKADLKIIPAILAVYILVLPTRRKQWAYFAFPVALMLLLAVPWGPSIFKKLPPFVPGSQGSEIGWMWQPASVDRLWDFIWSSGRDFFTNFNSPTLALAGILGPFLLLSMVGFLVWRMEAIDRVPWTILSRPMDRARTFVLIWFGGILVAISALPAINYIFRIRYGILTMVPVSLLLAWVFGLFVESSNRLPRWLFRAALVVFAVQCGINFNRSIDYRHSMGQVMIATDQVYEYVDKNITQGKVVLLPDFRPYDYRPDAGPVMAARSSVGSMDEIAQKYKPFETYAISWNPSLWEQVELVSHFSGCRETTLFDRLFKCRPGSGTYLMRFIGVDANYRNGEALRAQGKIREAFAEHELFLARHPQSLAGHFVVGLEAYQLQNWARAEQSYAYLEKYFPEHLSIVYNRALVLSSLGRHREAIRKLKFVLSREPSNYAALINLYYAHQRAGNTSQAKEVLVKMKRLFPDNREVEKLLSGA